MSLGYSVAIAAVPFLELLDQEEEELAAQVLGAEGVPLASDAIDKCRRRLALGVDAFVRALPTLVRNEASTARAAAYTLVGLVDERMLHHPAGGLDRWRDRLLEFELYGSALAGQEIIQRARACSYGPGDNAGDAASEFLLAPLYLGVLRAGFEGSLRGDPLALTSLITALEEAVGASRGSTEQMPTHARPKRVGISPIALAGLGVGVWLTAGLGVWATLPQESLADAERINERIGRALPITRSATDPLERSVGPAPPTDRTDADDPAGDAATDAGRQR